MRRRIIIQRDRRTPSTLLMTSRVTPLSARGQIQSPWLGEKVGSGINCKKVSGFPVPRRDVTYQTPPAGNNSIITGQGEFGK
jgi:hypothetical protein